MLPAFLSASLLATPALADNTFQSTCSEIRFAYQGDNATLQAICLRVDATPNVTSLVLRGISCGNIQILVDNGPTATLSAIWRMVNGNTQPTSQTLNNFANTNGTLVQR